MSTSAVPPFETSSPATLPDTATDERSQSIYARWRERRAERNRARLVSARNRRFLVRSLRSVANRAIDADPIRRRHDVLLHERAAAVRTDLLVIANMLERSENPNPACVAALRDLLTNGCDSPLYNPRVQPSELEATLDYVRSGL